MYDHIEDVLVNDSKIAEYLPEPVWMDAEGNEVSEENGIGFKVKIKYNRPDLAICCDEVGCNISQDGDGEEGGTKYVCHVDDEPAKSTTKADSHFTCLGLTRFDGEPLMCVILLSGKRRNLMVETGINTEANVPIIGDLEKDGQYEFFRNNFGKGKLFPSGPTCTYKGKDVPCFVRFCDKGGMSGEILTEIFKTLDDLQLFDEDRENGLVPFMLLDGHQSRFDLEFLRYINTYPHRWNVCIGVPYGTAIWQVGDSSEQNGKFKINITEVKAMILQTRIDQLNHAIQLMRTDIIPIVNGSYSSSFGNVKTNKKALCDRGWFPFNRNLLLNSTIRATILAEQLEEELQSGLFPSIRCSTIKSDNTHHDVLNDTSTISTTSNNDVSYVGGLNFNDGIAHYCATTIMTATDRQKARSTAYKLKQQGDTLRQRLLKVNTKMTAGKLVSQCRTHHLGLHVLEQAEQVETDRLSKLDEKYKRDEFIYLRNCAKADAAIAMNEKQHDNVLKWKKEHILDLIRPLKIMGDKAMPANKPELYQRYLETRHRDRRTVDAAIKKEFDDSLLVIDNYNLGDADEISVDNDVKEKTQNEGITTSL